VPGAEQCAERIDDEVRPAQGACDGLQRVSHRGRRRFPEANYIAIELEQKYCDIAERRLAGISRYIAIPKKPASQS
jgi:hypothetical protein